MGLSCEADWREWTKSAQKPQDVPANPAIVYADEWRGMGDWLGTGRLRTRDRQYMAFEEAREYARGLGLKNASEWRGWSRTAQKPADIPADPAGVYEDKWRGWQDWLGTISLWTRRVLLALLEDLRPRIPYLEEASLYAILSQGGAMPALMRKFGATSPLSVIKDLKDNAGEGLEEAVRGSEDAPFGEDEPIDENVTMDVTDVLNGDGKGGEVASTDEGLPTLLTSEGLGIVDELTSLPGGLEAEVAEYLVSNQVALLWDAYIKDQPTDHLLSNEGGYYYNLIRFRFESEREAVESLPVPEGWSYHENGSGALPPLPMQKRTAYQVLTKKRVGNWSGAGAGKTNSALLAIRVTESRNALVVVANATVDGWKKAIKISFPDTVIHTTPSEPVPGRYNITILNYEKFQQRSRGELARRLRDLAYDFVVLDEVQLAKQRNADKSYRREALEALVQVLAEENPQLHVLGMSATPVINNLYEGRKLLEIVQGRSFGDLDQRPTVSNALAVHRALMVYGFRYKPQYKVEFGEPEVVPTVRNDLLDELRAARGVPAVEQVLLQPKLEAILPYMRQGTLIRTYYVDGLVYPTRQFLEHRGYRVGVYTGAEKTGLDDFKEGRVGVLIGSQPVATGVDGLQKVCDRIVVLTPPWTGAEYEQLLGRVRRQGSVFEKVEVIWPQVVLDVDGDRWSWDERRHQVIEYKRTLSDCAVDGKIPDALSIKPRTLLRKSREALEEWIARIEEKGLSDYERAKLEIPLPPELRTKVQVRHGDFTTINNRWATSNSTTVHERLRIDPSEWYLYHTLYREAREGWEELPAEHIASHLRGRPDLKVGDFGCGECLLKAALPDHEVLGFDHVAVDDSATACDMAHVPLEDGSLGAAVFSLSLMGRNWAEYLAEAHRVLQPFGLLFVAEPVRRWVDGSLERAVEAAGFELLPGHQRGDFYYVRAVRGQ